MPKVSVIVPVYNAEKYIERCARSLFEQTLDDIEYIFVNDCSPDNSMQVLQNTLNEYPQRKKAVRIINHTKNTGQSGARWSGMCATTGDYIIHCDADDWVDIEMYEVMYKKAILTDAEAVCCDMVYEYAHSSQVLRYNTNYDDKQLMYDCIAPISVEYYSMCNRLISRKIFEIHLIRPFEGINMWDDVGLAVRARFHIGSTEVINKAFYHYNRENENSTFKRPTIDRVKEQIECVKQLEFFFISANALHKYQNFIAFLKFQAKESLLEDYTNIWISTFPEATKHLWKLHRHYSYRSMLKYYSLHIGKKYSIYIWELLKRIQQHGF